MGVYMMYIWGIYGTYIRYLWGMYLIYVYIHIYTYYVLYSILTKQADTKHYNILYTQILHNIKHCTNNILCNTIY